MSNVNKIKVLSERTSRFPPVIFEHGLSCDSEIVEKEEGAKDKRRL